MKNLRLLSLFSGIGAFEKALERIGVDYELVNYCEIDKYASKSYSLIHNESEDKNLWDITKIDIENLPTNIDLITHGSPCQDFSIAGKQAGGDEGSNTRSSLMWNSVEIIRHCKPKYVIWENVKGVLQKKNVHNFEKYLNVLEDIGYTNYYKVLNSKDYGIPQNRERIFVVSILDVDLFQFPNPLSTDIKLNDILEHSVEEKYYTSNELLYKFLQNNNLKFDKTNNNPVSRLGGIFDKDGKVHQSGSVYDKYYLAPTLTCCQGGHTQPYIIETPCICASRGKNPENPSSRVVGDKNSKQRLEVNKQGICNTLASAQKDNLVVTNEFRIRKLTPKEFWRLMGFDDQDIEICIKNGISNTQLYKQAGNSIVVNVLEEIFKNLFDKR